MMLLVVTASVAEPCLHATCCRSVAHLIFTASPGGALRVCQEHARYPVRARFGLQEGGLPPLVGAGRDREGPRAGEMA